MCNKGVETHPALDDAGPFIWAILLLVAFGLTLPGAMAGVRHFLMPISASSACRCAGRHGWPFSPSPSPWHPHHPWRLPAFQRRVGRSSLWVVLLVSVIAVPAGLMIFPVLAATGIDPASGPASPSTMPAVFQQLPFGQGLAVVFFSLLVAAAPPPPPSLLEHLGVLHVRAWAGPAARRANLVIAW